MILEKPTKTPFSGSMITTATFELHSPNFGHQDTFQEVKSGKNFKSII